MTDIDWPMWGDPGDLTAADPYGYRRSVISQTVMNRVSNALLAVANLPPLQLHIPTKYIGTRGVLCVCGHVAYRPERHQDHMEDL